MIQPEENNKWILRLFRGCFAFLFCVSFAFSCVYFAFPCVSAVTATNVQSAAEPFTVSVKVVGPPLPPPPPGKPGALILPKPPAEIIFSGRAYPNAFLTILRDGGVAATIEVPASGLFEKKLTGILGGTYTFSVFAEDTKGRLSPTLSFTIGVLSQRTTIISGIFIPPTISVASSEIEKGNRVTILGQSFPRSKIYILISPNEIIRQTQVDEKGQWSLDLDTSFLKPGKYTAKARALYIDGQQSPFSKTVSFLVKPKPKLPLVCRGADLNFDGRVDIIDFSILLYFWKQILPADRCSDINADGIVNLVDFSIMMYEWTG